MKLSNPLKYAIIIGLTGLVILILVIYVERKTISISNENQPLIALSAHLKNNSTKAHLLFGKGISGDKSLMLDKDIYGYLDFSVKLLNALLDGGETQLGVFQKATDNEIIKTINQSLLNISDFRLLAQERMKLRLESKTLQSGINPSGENVLVPDKKNAEGLDQAFDASYEKIQNNYEILGKQIQAKIARDQNMLYSLFWTSILLILIVFTVFGFLFYRILKNENLAKENFIRGEKRFRLLFEKAPIGIALIDPLTGIINNANSRYSEIVGRSMADINNLGWAQLTHPGDIKENSDNIALINAHKIKSFKMTKRLIRPDESIVWVDMSVASIESGNKGLSGCLCMIEDITERKQIEEEIINSQLNFEDAQQLSQIGSWEFSLLTFELKWSKELFRIFELEGQPSNQLYEAYRNKFHPHDIVKLDNAINNAIEKGEGYNFEHRIFCNDGSIKHLSCIGQVLKNAEGKVSHLKGTSQDITDRKKMEALLKTKEQNELLTRHASQVPGVIYQYQIYPDGKFFFPFVSEGVWDLAGITSEEAMQDGFKVFNLVHPDDLEALISTLHVFITPQEKWEHEFRINSIHNGTRWVRGNSNPEPLADGSILWHGYFADITDSKQAEEALQISKDKLEAVFNVSNDAIILSTRKRFFDCNPKTLEMFGFATKEEFTESPRSAISPAFQPDGRESLAKAKEMIEIAYEKGANRFEWVHQRKNGECFSAEVLLSVFNYVDERVIQATIHDITQRKLAKEKLIESEALLSTILQTLPVAVFCKDIKNDFQYTIWNKKAEEIYGLKAEDCVGKDDYESFPKETADLFRAYDIKATEMIGVFDIPEETVVTKNKRVVIHAQKTIVRDFNGAPHFILGVSEDIAERKKVEEKIKASEEKYRSVVENAADMIITFDKDNTIQFVNHLRPGTSTEQVIGRSIFSLIPEAYQRQVKQKIKDVFEGKKSQSYELEEQHIDGSSAWYSTNMGPVFSGDEVTGITLITRDITESKKAAEEIQQSLKEKEILLKEVHHRVKNNLQIILSILNLQYATIKDKKTLDLLRDIRSRIKAMSFIHELLYQTNDFSSINFSEYIGAITSNLVYSYSRNHTIDLKLEVGTLFLDLDRAIPCGLIINEIVTNALKYAFSEQEKGEVFISLTQKNEFIELVIADNGRGFPDSIDFSSTESLGMQLVVTLVQQLRGEISLDNSKGTKYTINFKNSKQSAIKEL